MAQIIIELSQEALDHATEMAHAYGYEGPEEHVREWMTNTAAGYERQKKQKEIAKLDSKITNDALTMYEKP